MLNEDLNCKWINTGKIFCFYFCDYFHRIFKEKGQIINTTAQETSNNEIIAYCSNCQKFFTGYLFDIAHFNIEQQELEIKKCLIHYFHHSDFNYLFLLSTLLLIYVTEPLEKMLVRF